MRRSPASIQRWNEAVMDARQAVSERMLPNGKPLLLENIFLLDVGALTDLAPEGGAAPSWDKRPG